MLQVSRVNYTLHSGWLNNKIQKISEYLSVRRILLSIQRLVVNIYMQRNEMGQGAHVMIMEFPRAAVFLLDVRLPSLENVTGL